MLDEEKFEENSTKAKAIVSGLVSSLSSSIHVKKGQLSFIDEDINSAKKYLQEALLHPRDVVDRVKRKFH